MVRLLSLLILSALAFPSANYGEPLGISVHIRFVDVDPEVRALLENTASSSMYLSCDTVEIDGEALSIALRKLATDDTLLESTPLRVWLRSQMPLTFYGLQARSSAMHGRHYVHYMGGTRSRPTSVISISIGPNGAAKGRIDLGPKKYMLMLSGKLPTHFLCLENPSFSGDM